MADQIISRLLLGLDTREFRNGIRQADKELKDWSKGVGKIGEMLGAAFAVGIIVKPSFSSSIRVSVAIASTSGTT